jgi:transposase
MQSYFIKELIGIKDIEVLDIKETQTHLEIMITTQPKEHTCPSCGEKTERIHSVFD